MKFHKKRVVHNTNCINFLKQRWKINLKTLIQILCTSDIRQTSIGWMESLEIFDILECSLVETYNLRRRKYKKKQSMYLSVKIFVLRWVEMEEGEKKSSNCRKPKKEITLTTTSYIWIFNIFILINIWTVHVSKKLFPLRAIYSWLWHPAISYTDDDVH